MCVARPNQKSVRSSQKSIITHQPPCPPSSNAVPTVLPTDLPQQAKQTNNNHQLVQEQTTDLTNCDKYGNTNLKSTIFANKVHVWILPLSLSQSKYGGRRKPSSACTLITLQVAFNFLSSDLKMPDHNNKNPQCLPVTILDLLVNSIVDGNETHRKAMEIRKNGYRGIITREDLENEELYQPTSSNFFSNFKRPMRDTFTIPEAIKVHRPELHEIDFKSYSGDFIENLVGAITMAVENEHLIGVSLLPFAILAYERAMSCVYNRNTNSICLLDTHMHFRGKSGSVIVLSNFNDLANFIITATKCVFPEVFMCKGLNGQFEISCLMLNTIYDKVHRGNIFLPLRDTKCCPLKSKKLAPIPTANGETESDSGYETDEENYSKKAFF